MPEVLCCLRVNSIVFLRQSKKEPCISYFPLTWRPEAKSLTLSNPQGILHEWARGRTTFKRRPFIFQPISGRRALPSLPHHEVIPPPKDSGRALIKWKNICRTSLEVGWKLWHKYLIYGSERRKGSTLSCVMTYWKKGRDCRWLEFWTRRNSFEGEDDSFRPTEVEVSGHPCEIIQQAHGNMGGEVGTRDRSHQHKL